MIPARPRILVVDDDPDLLRLMQIRLTSAATPCRPPERLCAVSATRTWW
jgi:hypothetical protein